MGVDSGQTTGGAAVAEAGLSPADEAHAAQLAAEVDLSGSLGVMELGQGRRRDFARTVDAGLQVLSASGAASAADAASSLLADLTPSEGPVARLLPMALRPPKPRRVRLTTEWLVRAETALKLRQAALIKERCLLDKLVTEARAEADDLAIAARAARLRAASEPGHAEELAQRVQQLDLSRLAAEQVAAALLLARQADVVSEQALALVVKHELPLWHQIVDQGGKSPEGLDTGEVKALAKAERVAAGATKDAAESLQVAHGKSEA